jgi:hypothetical protein
MKNWTLIPKVGIEIAKTKIYFGEHWNTIRRTLKTKDDEREGFHKYYENVLQTGCTLRLELDFEDGLFDILFMNGSIHYNNIELCNTSFDKLAAALIFNGMSVIKKYGFEGYVCPELCIEFMPKSDYGGETDRVDSLGIYRDVEYSED